MSRRHAFFVLYLQVSPFIDQELTHLVATLLDRVVNWSLVLGVGYV